MVKLRPHHALCIQKFTGHGYDEVFTRRMSELVSALAREPETPMLLTKGCDELCRHCPNNVSGACATLEKVNGMDAAVLTLCGYEYGQTLPWRELSLKTRKRIFETPDFEVVCSSCEWYDLCKNTNI